MEKTISMSTLAKHADRIAKDIETSRTVYRVRHPEGMDMLLMSKAEYDGWMMVIDMMQRPNWREELDEANRQFAAGEGRSLHEIELELGLDTRAQQKRRGSTRRTSGDRVTKGARRRAPTRRRSA